MQYREIGNTGIRVSAVGFGGMRFFNRDEETATAVVHRCLEKGITLFETGFNYGRGKSELWLGNALRGACSRADIVLANKASVSQLPDGATVRRALEDSLRNEQTDYFDLYSFWGCNTPAMFANVMRPGGAMEVILKAKEEGLVRAIGLTTHAQPETILDFARACHWDCITLKEHLLHVRQQETIAALGALGTGVIVMSPLAGGVIAAPGPAIARQLADSGMSAAVLGLRFLLANPHVTSAISGMTDPAEVDEDVRAGVTDAPLSAAEQRLVAVVQTATRALEIPFCTSCGYCMPCPQNVNIPGIFRLWNIMRGYGNEGYSRLEYQKLREQRHWADFPGVDAEHCVECGACEKKCPEKLAIMADLKRAHADLTAPDA